MAFGPCNVYKIALILLIDKWLYLISSIGIMWYFGNYVKRDLKFISNWSETNLKRRKTNKVHSGGMESSRFEELAKLPYDNPSMYQFTIIKVMGKTVA